jgi:homoserine O-succinyltransferase/O-acetyltransferase
VFECAQVAEHSLMQGLSQEFRVPHSRWNGVAQGDLTAHGYELLSRITGDGVDTFVKQEQSLFVFFQGHLEYETTTLMREYRRDVIRFVRGESTIYPVLPRGYFDVETEKALTALSTKAASCRGTALPNSLAAAMENCKVANEWQSSASRIYRNWLQLICASKKKVTMDALVGAEVV